MVTGVLAAVAALGVTLLLAEHWGLPRREVAAAASSVLGRLVAPSVRRATAPTGPAPARLLARAGAVGLVASVACSAVVGIGAPAVVLGVAGSAVPVALARRREAVATRRARACWPGIIEDIRIRVGSVGRPVPQALLEAGLAADDAVRPAFLAAQREWALTTDFRRTVAVLKDALVDPTADAVCETLLVVHEVGGDADRRLAALAEDRRGSLRDEAEAEARQAGARLARWFVIVVPAGMAFAGLNLGDGRTAYRTPGGQAAVVAAIALIALCWGWAGRIMRVPGRRRVFDR